MPTQLTFVKNITDFTVLFPLFIFVSIDIFCLISEINVINGVHY